jgi:hypothetical protein
MTEKTSPGTHYCDETASVSLKKNGGQCINVSVETHPKGRNVKDNHDNTGREGASLDFIRTIIEEDIRSHKNDGRVHTRFPPEPNGYLHIGHAKGAGIHRLHKARRALAGIRLGGP